MAAYGIQYAHPLGMRGVGQLSEAEQYRDTHSTQLRAPFKEAQPGVGTLIEFLNLFINKKVVPDNPNIGDS